MNFYSYQKKLKTHSLDSKILINELKSIVMEPKLSKYNDSFKLSFSTIDSFWVQRFVNSGEIVLDKDGQIVLTLNFQFHFVIFLFITIVTITAGCLNQMELIHTPFIIIPIWIVFFLIKNFSGMITTTIIKYRLNRLKNDIVQQAL